MNYDEWWEDFVAEHDDWKYADSEALRRAAFQAGAASRDAEVVSLTNQRDYEYVRAENAEQERDQLREQLADMTGRNLVNQNAVRLQKEKVAELREQVAVLREALKEAVEDYSDRFDMSSQSTNPGIKWIVKQGKEALAATEPKP